MFKSAFKTATHGILTEGYFAFGTDEDMQAAARQLRGEIMQVPPSFHSVKLGGRRLVRPVQADPDAETM